MRTERAIEAGILPPCGMGTAMRTVRMHDGPMTAWKYGEEQAWITYGPAGSRMRMAITGPGCVDYVRGVIEEEAARCGQPRTAGWITATTI